MRLILTTALLPTTHALRNINQLAREVNSLHYANGVETAQTSAECTFLNAFTDVGILTPCPIGTCIEDSTSSLGGRCVELFNEEDYYSYNSGSSYDGGSSTGGATFGIGTQRHLQTCTLTNGTASTRCTGPLACFNQNYATVACGSCNGKKSCMGMYKAIVEEGSCNGVKSCYKVYGGDGMVGVNDDGYSVVAEGSCNGQYSCGYFMGEFDMSVLKNRMLTLSVSNIEVYCSIFLT